jgi:hypothetical protein
MRDHFIKLIDEREKLRAKLPALQGKVLQGEIPTKVAITLESTFLISTIAWWLESGKQYSPKQIANWFLTLTINGYVHALGL